MPPAETIFKEAITNAAVNTEEEDLFPRWLASLAEYYSSSGERENAKDYALQGIVECGRLKNQHPDLMMALRKIFEANEDLTD